MKEKEALALIQKLDEIAAGAAEISALTNFEKAFATASIIADLQETLAPAMKPLMALQRSPLGYMTDKVYPEPEVKNALIEAILYGVQPCGNQFNIISGRAYITQAGFRYLLRKVEGLRYTATPKVPQMTQQGAICEVELEWEIGGTKGSKTLAFPIRVNSGMGADAVQGKALRKALAWLYRNIVPNADIPEGEAEAPAKQKPEAVEVVAEEKEQKPEEDWLSAAIPADSGVTAEDVRGYAEASKFLLEREHFEANRDKWLEAVRKWKQEAGK